jgi:hypothetical protein
MVMAGKPGQRGTNPDWVPAPYREDFLATLDGRTVVARELKARLTALHNDLGGEPNLSYQQRSLAKRAIYLEARAESMEAAMASGKDVELGQYIMSINAMVGLFRTLGLARQRTSVTLNSYLQDQADGD